MAQISKRPNLGQFFAVANIDPKSEMTTPRTVLVMKPDVLAPADAAIPKIIHKAMSMQFIAKPTCQLSPSELNLKSSINCLQYKSDVTTTNYVLRKLCQSVVLN